MNLSQIYHRVCQPKKIESRLIVGEVVGKSLASCFWTHGVNVFRWWRSHTRFAARRCAALVKTLLVLQRALQRMCEVVNATAEIR